MAGRGFFAGLPGWVKWVAVPLLALVVFGGVLGGILSFLFGLLFKVLLLVALVAGLIYVVRKVTRSGAGRGDL
ncbi:DUF5326 family protein [Streptomyces sp. NA04227]|uniref:DUF5326 family protein n=1 Tax=Streptomyces sp. NA04227 TaxID=2742136 RepID=UPI0015926D19|nr:DUF5326 family protein [Streptomyces sp. NA04227]QKW07847.1 DUF5326 family protein [Streptomyces sp. NA04227]